MENETKSSGKKRKSSFIRGADPGPLMRIAIQEFFRESRIVSSGSTQCGPAHLRDFPIHKILTKMRLSIAYSEGSLFDLTKKTRVGIRAKESP
eukprot:scaffold1354_cov144-Amphora_coffeaeformis.AAC.3